MERVTVEQNGERFTLEVEDGTTDDQIKAFLAQQQSGVPGGSGLQLEEEPMSTGEKVALGAGGAALAGGAAYGAYKAAPYVGPAVQAAAPALKQLPMNIAKQYVARPITGLAADAAALAHGLPPPTATQQALSAMGKGTQAAARQVVSTGPIAPTPSQVAGNPMLSEMARRQAAAQQQTMIQKGMEMATKMREIAAQKVMQNAGMLGKASIGLGALTYSGGLNAGEDEELRRRRMQPPTIR